MHLPADHMCAAESTARWCVPVECCSDELAVCGRRGWHCAAGVYTVRSLRETFDSVGHLVKIRESYGNRSRSARQREAYRVKTVRWRNSNLTVYWKFRK